MIGQSEVPKWRYAFNCKECVNMRWVDDDTKKRYGRFCMPMIDADDSGIEWHFDFDDEARTMNCRFYATEGEQMSMLEV